MNLLEPAAARELLEEMLSQGGDFAEIFLERRISHAIHLEDRNIEDVTSGHDLGAALRLVDGERTLFASTNRVDPEGIREVARSLASSLGGVPSTEVQEFGASRGEDPPLLARPPVEVPMEEKIEVLHRTDRGARCHDPRVRQVTVRYADSVQEVLVASSEGTWETDTRTYTTLYCTAVATEKGDTRTGTEVLSEMRGFEMFDRRSPYQVGNEAARLAVLQLDAVPAPAGTFPVVLSSSAGGTMVHEACGHGLEGDFVKKGLSIYAGKIGEQVASTNISVVDDGTLEHRRGSGRVDDEGCPTERVVLIEHGILRGYLHSRKSAGELSMKRTGNGRRESYRYLPIPRMRNTMILSGDADPEAILKSVSDGILVCRMGGGEVDITSGKFVFEVSEAYRIRDGAVAEPLRDATLIGTGPEVLSSIDLVGKDLGFGVGTCGKDGQGVPVADAQPTLRIPAIVVGGQGTETA